VSARAIALVLCATALLGSGCAAIQRRTAAPRGTPSGRAGWLVYSLEDLRVEAPAAWTAEGDGRRVALAAPGGRARLEITVPATAFPDERACLADAAQRMGGGAESLERVRRHPTKLAGRPGESLEADRGGWHVWAVAACDGGVQYRIFFTAENPAPADVVDVWRTLVQSARIGGEA
jgi:hypothetical protein